MKNKRGQGVTLLVSLMLGTVFFLLGLALAHPVSQVVSDARAETNESLNIGAGLNCSTVTAYQDKANCVAVDVMLPLFIGTIFGLGGFLLARSFL